MPAVRLEFEIDSEVYPELHAALSALKSTRARAERVRQLAAAGLVWEKVRLHGPAALAPAAEAPLRTDLVTRPDVLPPPATGTEPLPALARRTRRTRAAPEKPADAAFVDLAINAEPMPVPPTRPERRGPRPSRQDVEQAIRELPVLMDVVADVSPLHVTGVDVHEEPAPWAAMNAYPDDVLAAPPHEPREIREPHAAFDGVDDEAADVPEAALHVTALSHKPATRSRLMRMKERGLFKNG